MPREVYQFEEGKPDDKYTWIFWTHENDPAGVKHYLAGTAGRVYITRAAGVVDALNEYQLCMGECK
jgi:hypothetical protein